MLSSQVLSRQLIEDFIVLGSRYYKVQEYTYEPTRIIATHISIIWF